MRIERFEGVLHEIISRAGAPYAGAETFAGAGLADPRHGLVVHLATGAALHLQLVEIGGPPNEDRSVPEEPVTGPVPEPVEVPALPARAPLRIADVDAHLRALLINAQAPEVAAVELRAGVPILGPDQPGLRVRMHSGRTVIVMHRHILRPGEHPSEAGAHRPATEA